MRLGYRFALLLAALCCLAAPAFAAKPAPEIISNDTSKPPIDITSPSALCQMGIFDPPALVFGYVLPPADDYYTLLDPHQCGACPTGTYQITKAHVLLYWTAPCAIPVTVSIVPAFMNAAGCYVPNPIAPPLCPPTTTTVSDHGLLGDCVDVALPVASGCCIDQPMFLKIRFDQGSCPAGRPAFCGPASCVNCRQYNFYPGSPPAGDDLCAVLSPQGAYGVDMWVDADCCNATGVHHGSWGTLKTLYR